MKPPACGPRTAAILCRARRGWPKNKSGPQSAPGVLSILSAGLIDFGITTGGYFCAMYWFS
jgi:hypothetical protein